MKEEILVVNEDKYNLAALVWVSGIGWNTIFTILFNKKKLQFSWDEFWCDKNQAWVKCGLAESKQLLLIEFLKNSSVGAICDELNTKYIQVICASDEAYPALLKEIDEPPWVLFVKGPVDKLHRLQLSVAVVGTRENTNYSNQAIKKLISELAEYEVAIISGGMYGVDILAHLEAARQGLITVVVLGYGLDHIWPEEVKHDFRELYQAGAVFISEYPPYVMGNKGNFIRRNRIVAGLSLMTVVVEAAAKSGSHITAHLALEYGRCVGAVPGAITSRYSEGTKILLNNGAVCVSSGQDIIDEINQSYRNFRIDGGNTEKTFSLEILPKYKKMQYTFTPEQTNILENLESKAATEEELIHTLLLPPIRLQQILAELELLDCIERCVQGWTVTT